MICSRSAEYAIRSFVFLARAPDGKFTMARQIAEKERIPAHFLAKILQDLTRKGLLRSNKGPSGGFALRTPASQIRLLDLIEALDGNVFAESLEQAPWMLDSWKDLHSRIMDYLERNTIADVAKELDHKKAAAGKSKRGKRAANKKHRKEDLNGSFRSGPHGGRTDLPGGTRIRYLLQAAEGEHHLHGDSG